MLELTVAQYASTARFHKNNKPVPKPTVFKQIHENRLPAGVSAREVGGRYLITVQDPKEAYELIGIDPQDKKEIILMTGAESELRELADKLNKFCGNVPITVRPMVA